MVATSTRRKFAAAVAEIDAVVACHIVAGMADMLLEVVVPDLPAYEQLLLLAFLGLTRKLKTTPILRTLLRKVLDRAASAATKARLS